MGTTRRRHAPEPTPGSPADRAPDADPEAVTRGIVLRQLTMAPRSRAQLASALADRGAADDVAQRVLDRFEQVGLIDDAEFAAGWVRSRHRTRGLSRRALAHELRAKGIDDELAAQALASLDEDDERRAADQLVLRRLRSMRELPREKQLSRLVGLLARRGYGGSLAMQVVLAALDAGHAGEDPGDDSGDDPGGAGVL